MNQGRVLDVVAAVIEPEGMVLACRRHCPLAGRLLLVTERARGRIWPAALPSWVREIRQHRIQARA